VVGVVVLQSGSQSHAASQVAASLLQAHVVGVVILQSGSQSHALPLTVSQLPLLTLHGHTGVVVPTWQLGSHTHAWPSLSCTQCSATWSSQAHVFEQASSQKQAPPLAVLSQAAVLLQLQLGAALVVHPGSHLQALPSLSRAQVCGLRSSQLQSL